MAATSVVITGPAITEFLGAVQGTRSVATGNFTVTPNDVYTGVVSFSDLSLTDQTQAGGTFTPSSLTFSGTSTPQTFTYTPAKIGTQIIRVDFWPPTVTKSANLFVITTA